MGVIEVDLDRLSTGEKIVAGSGILLFILSFIPPWWSVDVPEGFDAVGLQSSGSAWDLRFLTKLGILLALVAAIVVIIKAFGTNLNLPVPAGTMYMVLAALAAVFLLLEVILGPAEGIDRGIFAFVGLALALVQTYGAWMHRSTEPGAPPATGTPPPAA